MENTKIITVNGNQAIIEKSGNFWLFEDPNGKVTKCKTIEAAVIAFKKFLKSDIQ